MQIPQAASAHDTMALSGAPSVLFDAVVVLAAKEAGAELAANANAVDWVRDAFGQCKVLGHSADAQPLLDAAGVKPDAGVIEIGKGADAFINAAKGGRIWAREPRLRPRLAQLHPAPSLAMRAQSTPTRPLPSRGQRGPIKITAKLRGGAAGDVLRAFHKMHNTFSHKILMCVFAGFGAACMFWMFRHVVQEAFYASGEGWKESLSGSTAEQRKP